MNGTLPDPGGIPSLLAGLVGIASGAYLAITGVMRTIQQHREKALVDRITSESQTSTQLHGDLVKARKKLADCHVLCEHTITQLKLAQIDAKSLQKIEAMYAELGKP